MASKFGKLDVARYLLENKKINPEIWQNLLNNRNENFLDIALSSSEIEPEQCEEFVSGI